MGDAADFPSRLKGGAALPRCQNLPLPRLRFSSFQQVRVVWLVGECPEGSTGVEEQNVFTEQIGTFFNFSQHALKRLAGVTGIEQHPFLPGELRVKFQIVVARDAVTAAEMAVEHL